jgi:hypothetical protein
MRTPPVRSIMLSVALFMAVLVVSHPAEAQLGALRRAAERRVEQKAEDRTAAANLIDPTFDATTVEITAERLDRYTAALERLKGQRAANRAKADEMQARRSALSDSANMFDNDSERNAYERATSRYSDCRSGVLRDAEAESERKAQATMARMQRDPVGAQSDPKVKEIMATMQAMSAASQRGDSVASRRAQERMMALMGVQATDSASLDRAAVGRCGARPAKPAGMVKVALYKARADSLEAQARALMSGAGGVKGAEVGMTDLQSRMFWERIMSWLNGMRQDAAITRTFSRPEYDLLVARRGALRRAFSGGE